MSKQLQKSRACKLSEMLPSGLAVHLCTTKHQAGHCVLVQEFKTHQKNLVNGREKRQLL